MKKIVILILLNILLVADCNYIGSGESGSTYHSIISSISKLSDLSLCNSNSRGLGENVLNISKKGNIKLAVVQTDYLTYVRNELNDNVKREKAKELKVVFKLPTSYLHIITLSSSDIKTIKDLKAKRVSIGVKGSGSYYTSKIIANNKSIKWEDVELNPKDSLNSLLKEEIDAMILISPLNNPLLNDINLKDKLKLIDIDNSNVRQLYTTAQIGANSYSWQKKTVHTLAIPHALVIHESEDSLAYKFAYELLKNLSKIPELKSVDFQFINSGFLEGIPVHKEVINAYRDFNQKVYNPPKSNAPIPAPTPIINKIKENKKVEKANEESKPKEVIKKVVEVKEVVKEVVKVKEVFDKDIVSKIQEFLKEFGYKISKVDGVYGQNTQREILKFQKDNNLEEDGTPDYKLLTFMQNLKNNSNKSIEEKVVDKVDVQTPTPTIEEEKKSVEEKKDNSKTSKENTQKVNKDNLTPTKESDLNSLFKEYQYYIIGVALTLIILILLLIFSKSKSQNQKFELVCIDGSKKGNKYPITKEFKIGRSDKKRKNDLIVNEGTVSTEHAIIKIERGELTLFDESLNGTYINEREIKNKPIKLQIGDKIKFSKSSGEVYQVV